MSARRVALLFVLVWGASLQGAPPAPRLGEMALLEDPKGDLAVADVAAAVPGRWKRVHDGFAARYTRIAHWLRFTVESPAGESWLDILPPFLDDVRLYEPDPARPGSFTERRAGDLLPFDAREVPYRGIVFRLRGTGGAPRTCYLRMQTTSSSMLNMRLRSPDVFLHDVGAEYGILVGTLGILLVVALLNLVTWAWLREPVHLLFVAYLLSLAAALAGFGGFVAQYLFPTSPLVADAWVGVAHQLNFSVGAALYRRLLLVERRQRVPFVAFELLTWGALAAVPATLLGYLPEAQRVLQPLVLLTAILAIPLAFRLWRRRLPGAGPLLSAILVSHAGVVAIVLEAVGAISSPWVVLYSLSVVALGSVLTLHVAIGARYRSLRDERRRAEEEARRAEADARRERELRRQRERFIDVVAHEYRTPLSILQTNLDILRLTDDAGERAESVRSMEVGLGRLGELFDETLRRGDWGDARQMRLDRIDLDPLLRRIVEREAPWNAGRHAVDLRTDGPSPVEADAQLLKTALLNLLGNAAKYSPPGGTIQVRLRRDGEKVVVAVGNDCASDPGLPVELLRGKGVRGDNAAGIPGEGMGLYLVGRLVEDMGGSLTLGMARPGRFEAAVAFPRSPGEDRA